MFGRRTSLSFTQAGQGPRCSERQQKLLRSAKEGGDEVMSGTHYTEDSGEEIDPRESETEDRGRKRVGFSSDPKGKQVVRRGSTRSPSPLNIDEETFREMMEDVLEGIKKQDEWIGKAAKEVGLALEGLTED